MTNPSIPSGEHAALALETLTDGSQVPAAALNTTMISSMVGTLEGGTPMPEPAERWKDFTQEVLDNGYNAHRVYSGGDLGDIIEDAQRLYGDDIKIVMGAITLSGAIRPWGRDSYTVFYKSK